MVMTQRSTEYVFQGTMYFFRKEKICCRYQFTLRDPIDPALLQTALDAALGAAPYFQVRLGWEKKAAYLEPNPNPCLVYEGSAMRDIPEQTNEYLFCVSYEGSAIYFDWYHFLADGHGISPFLTRILEQYCTLRYGEQFPQRGALASSPAYDIEQMMAQYPQPTAGESGLQREVVQTFEGQMRRTRIRFAKQSLVDAALANGVKPVSALMALLSLGVGEYLHKEEIQYSFSADTRDVAGVPDALYNCVCAYQHTLPAGQTVRLAEVAKLVDEEVQKDLLPQTKHRRMAEQMGWIYKVDQQKASLKIKQRVFQMGEYISGTPADYWLSYLGNPLMPASAALEQYITDFQVWVPPDGGSMGVEAASLKGTITLCIENKAPFPGLSGALRAVLEREGIPVLEAVDLDEN